MRILACDPGESFGYAVGDDDVIAHAGTAEMWQFAHHFGWAAAGEYPSSLSVDQELFERLEGVELVVIEEWRLYPWAAEALAWNECRTARVIGALEYICRERGIPYVMQPAKIKESAQAAGVENLYLSPRHENRHANDALQHFVYFNLSQDRRSVRWAEEGAAAG